MDKYYSYNISIKNTIIEDKPNEDYYICDNENGIYILVDGVSRDMKNGIYPNPSPSKMVSEIFVETVYDYLINHLDKRDENLLKNSMIEGNIAINRFNKKERWEHNFLPGTVGIVSIVDGEEFKYSYIGDCYGCLVSESKKDIFTRCQTKLIKEHKKEFSASKIRNKICNNKKHPYSYGVLNGDSRAINFIESGSLKFQESGKIILCSDGFSDIIEENNSKELLNLSLKDIDKISKNTDDKTMIIIEHL